MGSRPRRGDGPAKPKGNISFNKERALQLHDILLGAYYAREGPFADPNFVTAPEILAVQGMDNDLHKAQLLLNAISVDRRNSSERTYPRFRRAYDEDPKNIDPHYIASLSLDDCRAHFLKYFRVGMTEVTEQAHRTNAIVAQQYGGDPRNIFHGIDDVHIATTTLSDGDLKLPGFGQQMAKLLIKNYIETGLVQFKNPDEHPPKVDTWNTRISIATGVAEFAEDGWYHSWSIVGKLTQGWKDLSCTGRINGRLLNNLIWAVGSKLCIREDRTACYLRSCPLYETLCDKFPNSYDSGGQIKVGEEVRRTLDPKVFQQTLFAMQRVQQQRGRIYGTAQPLVSLEELGQNKLF